MTGTNTFNSADLAASIPEMWTTMMLEQKFPEFVLTDFVTDLSDQIVEGDIIHVPDIYTNTFTASTQSTEGAEVTLQSPAEIDRTITVDTQKYIAFILADKTMSQVLKSRNLSEKYAMMCKKTLLQELETALFGLYTTLTATPLGNAAAAMADLDFRSSIAYMEDLNFKGDNAVFLTNKVYFNQFIGLSKISANYSANLNVIKTGLLGEGVKNSQVKGVAYGIPVFTSSLVPVATSVAKNMMINKETFAYGVKRRGAGIVRLQSQYKLENMGMLTVADMIYGVGVLRPEAGVVINALNTATVA